MFQNYSLNMASSQCKRSACQLQQLWAMVKVNIYTKEHLKQFLSVNCAILWTDYRKKKIGKSKSKITSLLRTAAPSFVLNCKVTGFILYVPVNCTGWKVIKSSPISACIFSELIRARWEIPCSLQCHPCHPMTSWAPELSTSTANLFLTLRSARCHFMTGRQSRTWLMSLGWFFSWWWEPTYVPLSPIQPCCCFPYVTEYTQARKSARSLTTIKISMGIRAMARVSYHSHCKNPSGAWLCGITPSFCGIAPSLCGQPQPFLPQPLPRWWRVQGGHPLLMGMLRYGCKCRRRAPSSLACSVVKMHGIFILSSDHANAFLPLLQHKPCFYG